MSNNVSVPKEVLDQVVLVLRMYAESKWGWDGDDYSVVREWAEIYPEPKGFHFKAGGDMAKIALGELQRLLTQRPADGFSAWAGDDDQGDGIGFAEVHGW